jgi:polyisoprenoid-binding protein YceI
VTRSLATLLTCAHALLAPVAHADTVVADQSEIAFTMKQMGVNFDGRFRKWKADITFRPAALAQSKAEIDVDLASVDLSSADSENEAKGKLWFDTARFPVAHFSATSFQEAGPNRYTVAGKLSLKGVSRDYAIPITVRTDAAGNRTAEGSFAVKRLAHKVGEGEWSDTGTVADDVAVKVRIVLAPGQPGAAK